MQFVNLRGAEFEALKLLNLETVLVRVPEEPHGIARRPSHHIAKMLYIAGWFETAQIKGVDQPPHLCCVYLRRYIDGAPGHRQKQKSTEREKTSCVNPSLFSQFSLHSQWR